MDPQAIVDQAEAAYQAQDVDQIVELFHPEIVFYWNGWKKGEGVDELRELHEKTFGESAEGYEEFDVQKTLRSASGNTIAIEFETAWAKFDGKRGTGHGGEFFTMRDGLLLEWHAYHSLHNEDGQLITHPWDETGGH